jgi:hypothetical protein
MLLSDGCTQSNGCESTFDGWDEEVVVWLRRRCCRKAWCARGA